MISFITGYLKYTPFERLITAFYSVDFLPVFFPVKITNVQYNIFD